MTIWCCAVCGEAFVCTDGDHICMKCHRNGDADEWLDRQEEENG